jgi:hypothetical protein
MPNCLRILPDVDGSYSPIQKINELAGIRKIRRTTTGEIRRATFQSIRFANVHFSLFS